MPAELSRHSVGDKCGRNNCLTPRADSVGSRGSRYAIAGCNKLLNRDRLIALVKQRKLPHNRITRSYNTLGIGWGAT